tara:strand:- start:130 stop:663 length:534 start_codon:yes stop_codon:yes gene_type:complete
MEYVFSTDDCKRIEVFDSTEAGHAEMEKQADRYARFSCLEVTVTKARPSGRGIEIVYTSKDYFSLQDLWGKGLAWIVADSNRGIHIPQCAVGIVDFDATFRQYNLNMEEEARIVEAGHGEPYPADESRAEDYWESWEIIYGSLLVDKSGQHFTFHYDESGNLWGIRYPNSKYFDPEL